ncbi:MAG: hypothetical protein Q7I89_00520 [Syntrophales bacterium]|nr:hypothetical protein [Syntrophales bacterium]
MTQPVFSKSTKKMIAFALAIVVSLALFLSLAIAKPPDDDVNAVLLSAESLFKAMKQKNYKEIWQYLSAESKRSTIKAVYKSLRESKAEIDREQIGADFTEGGELAKAYWNSYLNVFDPDTVLQQSKWDIGFIKKDSAEISILYRKSKHPAMLLLYREANAWKVGLEETFRSRRWLLP